MQTKFEKIYVLSLITNHSRQEFIKQQMDDSAIDQIPVITENVPHYNANTYDCSHEGDRIY